MRALVAAPVPVPHAMPRRGGAAEGPTGGTPPLAAVCALALLALTVLAPVVVWEQRHARHGGPGAPRRAPPHDGVEAFASA